MLGRPAARVAEWIAELEMESRYSRLNHIEIVVVSDIFFDGPRNLAYTAFKTLVIFKPQIQKIHLPTLMQFWMTKQIQTGFRFTMHN